mmetsp:Transcript_3441/g.11511  ORF Transcript_3441/g.11511 Transcript_3441/m.11511 type:complete len:89 (+) Transcript_3441:210-476(+)
MFARQDVFPSGILRPIQSSPSYSGSYMNVYVSLALRHAETQAGIAWCLLSDRCLARVGWRCTFERLKQVVEIACRVRAPCMCARLLRV